jgi:aspartate/tyrosine/aromatic aminotransferase
MFDDFGNAYVFNSVVKAGEELNAAQRINLENSKKCETRKDASQRTVSNSSYLPIHGHPELIKLMGDVVWGSSNSDNIACVHAPGGTAAIRVVVDAIKLCKA